MISQDFNIYSSFLGFYIQEILSLAEISTEHKYLRLILKGAQYSPKELAGFVNEPAEGFLS